jgi:hypothetical protein
MVRLGQIARIEDAWQTAGPLRTATRREMGKRSRETDTAKHLIRPSLNSVLSANSIMARHTMLLVKSCGFSGDTHRQWRPAGSARLVHRRSR